MSKCFVEGSRRTFMWTAASILFFGLAGCVVKRESPVIELEDAYLVAPKAKHEMQVAINTEHYKSYLSGITPYVTIVGEADGFETSFSALPDRSAFIIVSRSGPMEIELDREGVAYQLNDESPIDVTLSIRESKHNPKYPDSYSLRVDFELVEPLSTYNVYMLGGSLISSTVDKIEEGEDDVHRFYFPFTIDGEKYAADISFRVKIRWKLDVDVPVTP